MSFAFQPAFQRTGFAFQQEVAGTQEQPSGGFFTEFEAARTRRLRRKREEERRQREAEAIQDAVTREIAEFLVEQEAKDEERLELSRIQALADQYAGHGMKIGLTRQVSAAILKAHEERSFNALQQMAREIERSMEEEEAAITAFLMLDDD